MDRSELLSFLRDQKWAVEASVSVHGAPQAAVIGVAVTDDLEIVFDTFDDSRKAENLRRNRKTALVIGWDDGRTAQIEGIADEPRGDELGRLTQAYLARFPDGEERAKTAKVAYFRVRPTWIRVSDFRGKGEVVLTLGPSDLRDPRRPSRGPREGREGREGRDGRGREAREPSAAPEPVVVAPLDEPAFDEAAWEETPAEADAPASSDIPPSGDGPTSSDAPSSEPPPPPSSSPSGSDQGSLF